MTSLALVLINHWFKVVSLHLIFLKLIVHRAVPMYARIRGTHLYGMSGIFLGWPYCGLSRWVCYYSLFSLPVFKGYIQIFKYPAFMWFWYYGTIQGSCGWFDLWWCMGNKRSIVHVGFIWFEYKKLDTRLEKIKVASL